jgi:lipoprotein-releasing system ATP-binding protein
MSRAFVVETKNLHKSYETGSEVLHVLKGVNLTIEQGEMVSIVGSSGAGKSTLLHILGVLDRPTSGHVFYEGFDIFSLSDEELAAFRNKSIGFVFQFHHLLPEFNAIENVMMPLLIGGSTPGPAAEKAFKLLSEVGLKDRIEHKPGELSGGEQQRVAIARAIVKEPKIVLADEPTGNLDMKTAALIGELLKYLNEEKQITFIIVTHNEKLARMAHKVIQLVDGTVSHVM